MTWTSLPGQPLAEELLYQGRTLSDWQEVLKDPIPGVRARAVKAFSHFGVSAIPVLTRALEDADVKVRATVVGALRMMGAPAVPALIQALGDTDDTVGNHAAHALEAIGSAAVQPLIQVLDNDDPRQRGVAAHTLGEIGAAAGEATAALRKVEMSDPSPVVRKEAEQALRRIEGR